MLLLEAEQGLLEKLVVRMGKGVETAVQTRSQRDRARVSVSLGSSQVCSLTVRRTTIVGTAA